MNGPGRTRGEKTRRDEVAHAWLVRIDQRPLSAAEEDQLATWMAADIRNRGAMIHAKTVWVATQRTVALRNGYSPPAPVANVWTRRSVAAALVAGVVAMSAIPAECREPMRYLKTEDEIIPPLPFPSGTVTLDSRSGLMVAANGAALIQGRCCVVSRAGLPLRVGCTRFVPHGSLVVEASGQMLRGVILSGEVEVQDPDRRVLSVLKAGQACLRRNGDVIRIYDVSPDELARQEAWSRGFIELQGEDLAAAAALFNRCNRTKLIVHDAMRRRSVAGSFRINDPTRFASTAKALLGAEIITTPGRIDLF